MTRLEDVLIEVKEIESFMRRRYLYEHPIFAHITTAIELIETEVAAQTPPPPVEPEEMVPEPVDPEPEIPEIVGDTEDTAEPEPTPDVVATPQVRRTRKRGKR